MDNIIEFGFNFDKCENNKPISQFIKDEFADDWEYIIGKISDWSFYHGYENKGISYLEFLEFIQQSFQAKKEQHIHELVTEKLKRIAPTKFNCKPELYASSRSYRTWFLLRDSFYEKINDTLSVTDKKYFFEWNTILDNRTLIECCKLNGKLFEANIDFIQIANSHWGEAKEHCRCYISVLSERMLERRKFKAP